MAIVLVRLGLLGGVEYLDKIARIGGGGDQFKFEIGLGGLG